MQRLYRNSRLPFERLVSLKKKIVYGKGDLETAEGKVLVLFDFPTDEEAAAGEALISDQHKIVDNIFKKSGLDPDKNVYYTYIFKIKPNKDQEITFNDFKFASKLVCDEFDLLKPKVVVTFGIFSTTLAVAAHMNEAYLDITKWRRFILSDPNKNAVQTFEQKSFAEFQEKQKQREELTNKIEKQKRIANGEYPHVESDYNAMNITDKKLFFDKTYELYLLSIYKVNGEQQHVYKKDIRHCCWAMALSNPYVIKSSGIPEQRTEWIKSLEFVKTFLTRPPPVMIEYVEDIKKEAFNLNTIVDGNSIPRKPSTYMDVAERICSKAYKENGVTLRASYDNGDKEISFQIQTMEYCKENNEFGLFGKTLDEKSIYCRIPHKPSELINFFYIKYPSCWRAGTQMKKTNLHFNYEKEYLKETANRRMMLSMKTAQLRKLLRKKIEMPMYEREIKNFDLNASSICTEKLKALCGVDVKPASWKALDELISFRLDFELKNTFKSYNTQEKPRIKVSVKYNPFRKLILCCLRELVREDSRIALSKQLQQKQSLTNTSNTSSIQILTSKSIEIDEKTSIIDEQSMQEDEYCETEEERKKQYELSFLTIEQESCDNPIPTTTIENQDKTNTIEESEKQELEDIRVYEIDCSDTQRLSLNYGIYTGGWVRLKAKGYQFVPEQPDDSFKLLKDCVKYCKLNLFNGYKKSFQDMEVITFTDQIETFNPNRELDLKNELRDLESNQKKIKKELEHHEKKFTERTAKNLAQNRETKKSSKYIKWIEIQNRRLTNINNRIDVLNQELKTNVARWAKNVGQRVMIYDDECLTDGKRFPSAANSPIISITAYIVNIDDKLKLGKRFSVKKNENYGTGIPQEWEEVAYFVLGWIDDKDMEKKRQMDIDELGKTKRVSIYRFATERELLRGWLVFRTDRDINIEVGHNNENFDLPYELKRCMVLGLYDHAPFKCVYGTKKMFTPIELEKVSTFSKAFGAKSQTMINMHGSSCLDTYTIGNKEQKFSSFTLNFLSMFYFDTKKADCPHEAIPGAFYNDQERLTFYNDKDVALTARLFLNWNSAINSIEFIKLAGCFSQQECYTRGQQFKVLAFIMRSIQNANVNIPIDAPPNTVSKIYEAFDQQVQRYVKKMNEENGGNNDPFNDVEYGNTLTSKPLINKKPNGNFHYGGSKSSDGSNEEDDDEDPEDSDSDDDEDDEDDDNLEIDFKTMTLKRKKKPAKKSKKSSDPIPSTDVTNDKKNLFKKSKIEQLGDNISKSQGFADFNQYIEETVVDQVKRAERAYSYKTKSQQKKESERFQYKSKLTKKEQLKMKEMARKTHRLTDLWTQNVKKDPSSAEVEEKNDTTTFSSVIANNNANAEKTILKKVEIDNVKKPVIFKQQQQEETATVKTLVKSMATNSSAPKKSLINPFTIAASKKKPLEISKTVISEEPTVKRKHIVIEHDQNDNTGNIFSIEKEKKKLKVVETFDVVKKNEKNNNNDDDEEICRTVPKDMKLTEKDDKKTLLFSKKRKVDEILDTRDPGGENENSDSSEDDDDEENNDESSDSEEKNDNPTLDCEDDEKNVKYKEKTPEEQERKRRMIEIGRKRKAENISVLEAEEKAKLEKEKEKAKEGPKYQGATCIEPIRGLHIVKREDMIKEYAKDNFEQARRVKVIDKLTGEISYPVFDDLMNSKVEYIARFILCCDFASLYPSVCIAMNTAQDKKLTMRKLILLGFPIQFCNVSTEKWPDKCVKKNQQIDGQIVPKENWVFFVKSDYQPSILNRCRDLDDENCPGISTESLLELYEHIAYNEKYRFLTEIYEKILISRGVDLSHVTRVAKHINVPKIKFDYMPPNANAKEYNPPVKENLDFELYECDIEYGKYNQELDEILIKYWPDQHNQKYDIVEHPSRGVLPTYSQACLSKRAIAKDEVKKAEKGSSLEKAWDSAQNALKVHANSGYGVTGSDENMGKLGDVTLSATITGYGRLLLEYIKNWFCKGTGRTYNFNFVDQKDKRQKELIFEFGCEATKETNNNLNGGKNFGGDTDSFFNTIYGITYVLVEIMGEKEFCKFIQILVDEANDTLPPAVRSLFEKIMYPFCSVNKKRYAYIGFKRTEIKYMGLESKRRDNCQYSRDTQVRILEMLLMKMDIDGAIKYIREQSKNLLEGKVDIMQLVVTKQYYRVDYKSDTLPHLVVVRKALHRGEIPYEVGQRVPYIITIGPKEIKTKSLNAEDPTYAMMNKLVPDYQYYFEKQIVGPSLRIFARVPGIGTEEVALRTVFSNISNKVFQQRLQKMDAIAKYVDIIRECILCGKKSKKICCNECFKTREPEIDAQMEKAFAASTLKVRTCIDTCKKCLNQNEDEIHCENIHCDEYVPRKMSAVELAIVGENRRELMELKQSGKLEW